MRKVVYKGGKSRAARVGAGYYKTGKICNRCGKAASRSTETGECTNCRRLKMAKKSAKARRANATEAEALAVLEYKRKYYAKNKEVLAMRQREYIIKPASYATFAANLPVTDCATCSEDGLLVVECYHCHKRFTPTRRQATKRIESVSGSVTLGTQSNFYCSDECKKECAVFGKVTARSRRKSFNSRLLEAWAEDVKRLAGYKCEICGSEENLEAHHILPKSTDPNFAYDIDNGVCLCSSCHRDKGHSGPCSSASIAENSCYNFPISRVSASAASLV